MRRRLIFLLTLLTTLSACFPNNAPIHFYMLEPIAPTLSASSAAVGTRALTIGLGPIGIPGYLDRPQIVTALSDQEYQLAEDQRWAERLDNTITRVLAENLSNLLATERIVFHPWQAQQKVDAQISVNIQEFHADQTGQVRLNALWALKRQESEPLQRKFSCREPASTSDYASIAAAHGVCLGRLSREIADAAQGLPAATPMIK